MTADQPTDAGSALTRRVVHRVARATLAANLGGAVSVFVGLAFVGGGAELSGAERVEVAAVFAVFVAVVFPLSGVAVGWVSRGAMAPLVTSGRAGRRAWRATFALPSFVAAGSVTLWALAALVFATHSALRLDQTPGEAAAVGVPGLMLSWLDTALREGVPFDHRPGELEAGVVEAADTTRVAGTFGLTRRAFTEAGSQPLVTCGDGWRAVEEGEAHDVVLWWGPATTGGMVRAAFTSEPLPVGDPVAPLAARVLRHADDVLGTDFGPLEPARRVR